MKTLKKNNRGLTLVELIVAIAILAIAGIVIGGLVSFCSKQFANSNKNVKLQYEQQMVVNRIRDIILEASRGVSYEDDVLGIYSDNPDYDYTHKNDSSYTVPPYIYSELKYVNGKKANGDESEAGTLYYGYKKWSKDMDTGVSLSALSEDISDFKVDLSELETKNQITLTITFKVSNKEITVNPVITLRNKISEVTDTEDFSDLYEGEVIELYSPIEKIEISRDGKTFAQSKVDTIKMVDSPATNSQTSAEYVAKVTKKPTYNGSVDTTVTWKIDPSSVKDGYEKCIKLSASGNSAIVTVNTVKEGDKVVGPEEYTVSGYFIIVATSNEDPAKSARLRIKVESGGVYPKKITTDEASKSAYIIDKENAKLIYTFKHSIEYTGKIKDPISGSMVNPLTGDGVYQKITYSVDALQGDAPPAGAGFTQTDEVDGRFVVSKSMEGHTYHIVVTVSQRDQNGEIVKDEFDLTIPEGVVPDEPVQDPMPVLFAPDSVKRNESADLSAGWTNGTPQAKDDKGNVLFDYNYYYFEYEVTWNDNECKKWTTDSSNTRNNFDKSIKWINDGGTITDMGTSKYYLITRDYYRLSKLYVESFLNWNDSFSIKVNLRAKISQYSNSGTNLYYMKPGTDPAHPYACTTTDPNMAATVSKVITINPVELTLIPVGNVHFYRNNEKAQGEIYSVFDDRLDIGLGLKYNGYDWQLNQEKDNYYKIFIPEFEGFSFLRDNYIGPDYYTPKVHIINSLKSGETTLQTYTKETDGSYVYKTSGVTGYTTGIQKHTQFSTYVYMYLRMTPSAWKTNNYLPIGVRWICVVEDDYGNSVTAKFKYTDKSGKEVITDFMNYKFYNAYEGEY